MRVRSIAALSVVLGLAVDVRSAAADEACPTTENSVRAILKVHGFNAVPGHRYVYDVGMVDFFVRVVAACVRDETARTQTLYAMTHGPGHLLGHLPAQENHWCLSDDPSISETTYVVESNQTLCGTTMFPLDYHGTFVLVQYGRNGSEHLHGGLGVDWLYGGPGNDRIFDYSVNSSSGSGGILYGESGDDRLYGSGGGWTTLYGGPGVDSLIDYGSGRDVLLGGDGNDCCLWMPPSQVNNPGSLIDCGNHGGTVSNLAGTVNCNGSPSPQCGPLPFSCPWF